MRRRFGKFALVGCLGAGLQLSLIFLLTQYFGVSGVVATAAAVEITLLHNFLWHERFTWCERRISRIRQTAIRLVRFHAGNGVVSLLGNMALVYWLVDGLKLPVMPSGIAAIALCSAANFLLADRWVYPKYWETADRSERATDWLNREL